MSTVPVSVAERERFSSFPNELRALIYKRTLGGAPIICRAPFGFLELDEDEPLACLYGYKVPPIAIMNTVI
jgi:hypothetical protein